MLSPATTTSTTASSTTIVAMITSPRSRKRMALRVSGPLAPQVWEEVVETPWPNAYTREDQDVKAGPFCVPCLCLCMPMGRSYTKEHVLELHFPANETLSRHLLERLFSLDVMPAEPGEFTRRAFLNGRLDLNEAQSVAALIAATDDEQRRQAVQMMSGGAGDVVKALKDALFILRRNLEAVIDFPEEPDIDPTVFRWQYDVDQLKANLVQWRQSASRSSSSDVAIKVLLLGPANAGKSSLIRALIPGSQPVISHQAGTTLDLIPYALSSEEGPVHLYDSPGLKVAEGRLDELSLERLMARLPSFDAIIQMADREQWQSVEWPSFDAETPSLQVLSKADQLFQEDEVSEKNEASPENEPFREGTLPENRLQLSSLRGDGLKELKLQLSAWSREWSQKKASPMEALKNRLLDLCADRLTRVDAILLNAWPEEELAAYELDELLDEIDGFSFEEGGSEALLDGIFRDFCIGK